jgi:hypothetical protein
VDALNAQYPDKLSIPKMRAQGVVLYATMDEPKGNVTIWDTSAQVTGALVDLDFDFGPTAH